jgi:DNA-binding transcriptional ArsR family regulator
MSLDNTLAALGNPPRREILRRLADAPCRAGDLASGFAISRSAICKHTRLLTTAGLIRARKSWRERIYELAPSGGERMREIIEQLKEMERFWEVALENLQKVRGEKEMTIRKSIWIGRSPELSFRMFCEDIGEWWPAGFGGMDSRLFPERAVGGRFYERRPDGTEYESGRSPPISHRSGSVR